MIRRQTSQRHLSLSGTSSASWDCLDISSSIAHHPECPVQIFFFLLKRLSRMQLWQKKKKGAKKVKHPNLTSLPLCLVNAVLIYHTSLADTFPFPQLVWSCQRPPATSAYQPFEITAASFLRHPARRRWRRRGYGGWTCAGMSAALMDFGSTVKLALGPANGI